jgi:UDP-GlcNAc:undecaprenyl-phosphate GlcNAc-1-phosphate transferase
MGSVLAASVVAAAIAGVIARALALRLGAVDHPGALKPHARPTPFLGGVAIGAGIAAGMLILPRSLPWQIPLALGGVWALGLVDDLRSVPPGVRLLAQLAFGLVVAAGGVVARAFPTTGLRWAGTALLFAGAINAVNMLDGMDGLAGAAGLMSASALAIVAAGSGTWEEALAAAVAAAAAGFLLHNRPPARLFLGDNGAYLLAGALAAVVLSEGVTWPRLLGSLTCLGVFNLDLALAVLRRIGGGVRLTGGDRGHLYDQLLARGRSETGTLVAMLSVHLVILLAGVGIAKLSTPWAAAASTVLWLVAIGALARFGFLSRTPA